MNKTEAFRAAGTKDRSLMHKYPSGLLLRVLTELPLLVSVLLLGACDGPQSVKTDWTISKFGIPDGAFRIGVESLRINRELQIRCFGQTEAAPRNLDIRYTIYTSPPLDKMDTAFKGVDGLSVNVSIDDGPATIMKARSGFRGGLWFLGDIDRALAEKMANATNKIVAVPHLIREPLDVVVEFGVSGLPKLIGTVLEACSKGVPQPTPAAKTPKG